jgi:bifunctional non-homologous end joining protein LigD
VPRRSTHVDIIRQKQAFALSGEEGKILESRAFSGCFVVQKHDLRQLHFDFRLELGDVMKSWAITRGPSLDPGEKRLAVRTDDHPLDRDTLEGRGADGVQNDLVWDRGRWRSRGDPQAGLQKGLLKFELEGDRLNGGFVFVRLGKKARDTRENWLLIKEEDRFAEPDDRSIAPSLGQLSIGRRLDAIVQGNREAPRGRSKKRMRGVDKLVTIAGGLGQQQRRIFEIASALLKNLSMTWLRASSFSRGTMRRPSGTA